MSGSEGRPPDSATPGEAAVHVEQAKTSAIRRHSAISAASNYGGQLINLGVWFLLTPFMILRLGTTQYGLWVLVASFVAYGNLASLGISSAIVKYVAEYRARGESDTASELIATALAIYVVLGLAMVVVALIISPIVPHVLKVPVDQRGTTSLLVIVTAAGVAVQLPASAAASVLSGIGRFDLMNLIGSLAMLTLGASFVVTLELGGNVVALSAITIPIAITFLVPTVWIIRRAAPDLRFGFRGAKRSEVRRVALFSSALFGIQVAGVVKLQSDEIVIGSALPVRFVSPYSLARRISGLPGSLAYQLVQVILPLASRLHAEGDMGRLRAVMLSGLRLTTAAFSVIGCPLIIFAAPFLRAWVGQKFASAAEITVLLTVAALMQVMMLPVSAALQGMARHRPLVIFALAGASLNLALSIVLVGPVGVRGVALGTLIATALEVTVVMVYASRVVTVSAREILGRALLPALGPAIPMMGALALIRYTIGPSTIPQIALAGLTGAVVYFAFYLAMPAAAEERAVAGFLLARVWRLGRRRGRAGASGIDGNVSGLGGDAPQPRADRRIDREVEATLVRDVRVGVEGDVGDREAVGDEEGPIP